MTLLNRQEFHKLNESNLTGPTNEMLEMLQNAIGGEESFKKIVNLALQKSKYKGKISNINFSWRNLGIYSTFQSGQYICCFSIRDKIISDTTASGEYHEQTSVPGLFQISLTYRNGDDTKARYRSDVYFNCSTNVPGGQNIYKQMKLDLINKIENKKMITDYVINTLNSI